LSAIVERLRELGWTEGRSVAMAFRWAGGHSERYSEIATEFVGLKVDVIVTFGTPAALATKQATAVVPIVIALAGDPVGAGLVASLARPGGNITGLSSQSPDLTGKRLALLREVVPNLRRLAIMGNVVSPTGLLEMKESQAAARALGLEAVPVEISNMPTLTAPRTTSAASASCFSGSVSKVASVPVTFPPGRAWLATRPKATGSVTFAATIGMAAVA
jgi:putative tryptophan/tyrosine transport system substrate-binding protein